MILVKSKLSTKKKSPLIFDTYKYKEKQQKKLYNQVNILFLFLFLFYLIFIHFIKEVLLFVNRH